MRLKTYTQIFSTSILFSLAFLVSSLNSYGEEVKPMATITFPNGEEIDDDDEVKPFDGATITNEFTGNLFVVTISFSTNPTVVDKGTLDVGDGGFVYSDVDDNYTLSASSKEEVESALANLVYTPAPNQVSVGTSYDVTFNVTIVEDIISSNTDEDAVVITVNSVNDAPTINGVSQPTIPDDEDTQPFVSILIEDVDPSDNLKAVFNYSSYTSEVEELSSLGGFVDDGNGNYEFSGFDIDIQTALQGIVFTPQENLYITDEIVTFELTISDASNAQVLSTGTKVTIQPQNDAPTISGLIDISTAVFDNASDIFPFSNATITDNDEQGDQNVTVLIELNDTDNGILDDLPAGSTGDATNGYSFSGTPSQLTTQIRDITFNPDDNEISIGTTEATIFTVTVDDGIFTPLPSSSVSVLVKPFNDSPEFTNSPTSLQLVEDNTSPGTPAYSFQAEAIDVDDQDNPTSGLTYSISITFDGNTYDENNLPNNFWLNFNTSTGLLSGTPEDGDDGFYTIEISVTDNGSNKVGQGPFVISVQAENSRPVFTAPDDQIVGVNTTNASLQITGIDVGDNDPNQEITEIIVTSDNQALINNANLSTNFNPSNPNKPNVTLNYSTENGQSGSAEISITVRDNGTTNNEDEQTFTITVDAINTAPFVPDLSVGFDREEDVNQSIIINGITPGDANQEIVSDKIRITSLSPDIISNQNLEAVLSGGNGNSPYTVTINYDLVPNAFGVAQLELRVEDNGSTLSGTNFKVVVFDVRVAQVDDVPVILGQRTSLDISEGQRFFLSLNDFDISHPANENETLTLNILSGNNYTIGDTDEIIPEAGFNGTLQVKVTVSDEGDDNGNQVLTSNPPAVYFVNIDEINTAPEIVNQTPDTISVREDDSFILTKSNLVIRDDNPIGEISISEVRTRAGGNYTANGTEITPSANFNGIISVPVVVSDGDNTSEPYDVIIRVLPVNDAPQITGQFDIEIREEDTYEINLGDLNVTDVDNDDFTLLIGKGLNYTIVEGTRIKANDDFFGTLTIPVQVNDGSTDSEVFNFDIDVIPVNDAPTINALANRTVGDDNGQTLFVNFSGVTVGPNETGQNLTITATSGNQSLIQTVDVIYTPNQSVGLLRMETIPERDGVTTITVTVQDDGGTDDGGVDSKVITFDVTVIGVNSAPTLDFISDINLLEDFDPTPVRLRNIRDGDDGDQEITITAVSSNPALIPNPIINYVQGETEGTLIYNPVPGQNGTATITVTVKDNAGTANGGEDTYQVIFEISILGLNDRPTIDAVADTSLLEDSESLTLLLTGITDGDAEAVQKMTISAESSRPEILPDPIVLYDSVSTTAELILTPAVNISGTSTISITVKDDGGSLVAGQEDTRVITFEVTVLPVNDAPTINDITNTLRLLEGAETQRQLLTGITDGDSELIQSITSVTVTSNKSDFYESLEIAYREGDTNGELIFKTDPDANGMDTITITVTDNGGIDNGGINTTTTTVFVDVLPLNDAPTLDNPPRLEVLKNAGEECITISGITDGDPELEQNVELTAISNRPDIIPDPILSDFKPVDGVATLCFTPLEDARGVVEITLTAQDDGGLPGNDKRSVIITIDVGGVNNPPVIIGEDGMPLEEVNLTTSKDEPLDICFQVIDRDQDEVDLGEIIARNSDASGEIIPGSFTFKDDSLCFIYEAYPNTLSGEDWFEFTICDDVPGDIACDTIRLNIVILPSSELIVYDGISPTNPDGRNDAWFIEGIENYPENLVQIYSPTGELVYEVSGYDNRNQLWRGESNKGIVLGARELPTGVYYYVIDLGDGASSPLKGSVIIK